MQERYSLKQKVGMDGLGAGVWNLGPGGDPFGGPTREPIPILDRLPLLAEAGMSFYEAHDVEIPASDAGKLFHIHLNSQDGQRYDQNLPFGYTEPLKDLALLVVLQDAGYAGPICFDIKAPRTDDLKDIADIITVSSNNLLWLWDRALAVDRNKIARFREENRATALSGYLAQCLYGR